MSCSSSRWTRSPKARPCSTAPTGSRRRSATRPGSAQLRAIDATCPLVTKVHLEADQVRPRRLHHHPDRPRGARRGHRHHGRSPRPDGPGRDRRGRRATRGRRPAKIAYLTQTTLSVDDANLVIAALRKKFPQIANPPKDDICYATQNRQEAVRELAARCRRGARPGEPEQLEQQAAGRDRRCARAALAPDRRRRGDPSGVVRRGGTVLITAGASAPEDVVQECIEYLAAVATGRRSRRSRVREENVHFPLPKSLRELLPVSVASDDQD